MDKVPVGRLLEELNIKSIKALEDISKKRELFRRRSSAYTQN